MRVGDICQAITGGDIKQLTTLPGVGKKTAERICVDLKDKVGHLSAGSLTASPGGAELMPVAGSASADALSALMNLGYPAPVARRALGAVKRQLGEEEYADLRVEVLIREALRTLA